MRYRMDEQDSRPAYLKLYEALREDIVQGIYRYGEKLPSKRVLSAEVGVSLMTVEHAMEILSDEGYAVGKERSGYFVIYRESDCFAASAPLAEDAPRRHPTVKSEEEAFPFSVLARTMRRVIGERGEEILRKSPNKGLPELRVAIAAYLARSRGITVEAEQIVIGSGAEYLYSIAIQLLGRDLLFAVENPCYQKILQVYRGNGVSFEALPMGKTGIESKALEGAKARVLHVTPYHSFPSGITATASKKQEYLSYVREKNGYLIEDDFASEFTVSTKLEDTLFSLDREGRVLYLNTFTKTVAPSVRVGYMILPPALLEKFDKAVGLYSCTVPTFEQYVLAELLSSGDFERHINRVRRTLRRALGK